ncbi:hypothetical protein PGT21_013063 [Puccinia graminis f. sp. tritici]|uniref:Uncharacterized protein n=1 Tax=Puccinia graminis f. sp. tritici TaxID=56615 RepID=A0A5B0NN21_PUCGR|nr:hypothetical protein PGT21_013063 [Puccinia graminis f. sp. tritici]KAA1089924.1 hypothetical protein PGTUg99_030196 [Puccinia graminis f. sp. tritici]
MLIQSVSRTMELLVLCCLKANECVPVMFPEMLISGRIVNRRIALPGMELENGLNEPEKESDILKYMATVPQLRKQTSNLEKAERSAPVYTCVEFLEKSKMKLMRDDFWFIKEDLAKLLEGKLVDGSTKITTESLKLELELFQTKIDELNSILNFILLAIQRQIFHHESNKKEVSNSLKLRESKDKKRSSEKVCVTPSSSTKELDSNNLSETSKLGRDELELIEEFVPKTLAKDLIALLDKIETLGVDEEIDPNDVKTFIALRLQSLVIQGIGYLYKYNLINTQEVKDLFESKSKMDLAAINMDLIFKINGGFDQYIPICLSGKLILRSQHSSHFRVLFEALDEDKRRYISYACLKLIYYYHILETKFIDFEDTPEQRSAREKMNQFLENDQLFKILEEHISTQPPSNLYSKKSMNEGITNMEIIKDLKKEFIYPGPELFHDINIAIQFFILNFIEENYTNFFLEIQKDDKVLKTKLDLMTASFNLIQEVKNLKEYLHLLHNMIDPKFEGFQHLEMKEMTRKGALQELELLSSYLQIISFKYEKQSMHLSQGISDEKYLQYEKINLFIRFTQDFIYLVHFQILCFLS